MPNRILKDSICTSDSIDTLSPEAEIFFYRLIVQCDDYGRFDARPSVLRARCFPLRLDRITDQDVSDWLNELIATKTVEVYEVNGKPFLQFTSWSEHQQVRAARSKYPPPMKRDSNGNQPLASASECARNPIQSESESESNPVVAPPAPEPPAPPPDPLTQAVCNAYDAAGLMTSKTHLDAHLETIKRTGLPAWQLGWAEALGKGKHNFPAYVARCAESAMIAQQQAAQKGSNGRTDANKGPLAQLKARDPRPAWNPTADELARAQAEWDASPTGAQLKAAGLSPV